METRNLYMKPMIEIVPYYESILDDWLGETAGTGDVGAKGNSFSYEDESDENSSDDLWEDAENGFGI